MMKWIGRIVGVVVGLIGIVVGLTAIFGEPVLPDCDQKETTDVIREVVAGRAPALPIAKMSKEDVMKAVEIGDIAETSFDKDKQVRTCKAALSLKAGTTTVYDKLKVGYTINWIDQKKGTFQVEVKAE